MTADIPQPSSRTALITGASSGLGAEFARQLAAQGYDLILVARYEERLAELGDTLHASFGITPFPLPADLASQAGINQVVQVIGQVQNLEMLINNAGFVLRGRFYRVGVEKEHAMLMVHIVAPVMLCRAALPIMLARNNGYIINVSSMAGLIPIRTILYGTSKNFLVRFSESLQAELRDTPLRIQVLCPGYVFTESHDTAEYAAFSRTVIPRILWITPKQVVNTSLRSVRKPRVTCIPGNIHKLAGALSRNSLTMGLIIFFAQHILRRRRSA